MRTTLEERPCLSCVISTFGSNFATAAATALATAPAAAVAAASAAALSSGFCTRYLAIFLSILMVMNCLRLELAVVAFFQCVVEIGGGVLLAVVFDLFVALHRNFRAVLEREHIGRVLEVVFLHQHALESFRVEAERGAALQILLMGVQIDVFEALVFVIRRHVRSL